MFTEKCRRGGRRVVRLSERKFGIWLKICQERTELPQTPVIKHSQLMLVKEKANRQKQYRSRESKRFRSFYVI